MSSKGSSTKTIKVMSRVILYTVMIMLLVVLGIKGFTFGQEIFSGQGIEERPGKEIEVVIPDGATQSEVTDILMENGLIENAYIFRIQCYIYEAKFYAGTFNLNTSDGPEELIETLKIQPEEETTSK